MYHQGPVFGLIADDVLHLKVDVQSKPLLTRSPLRRILTTWSWLNRFFLMALEPCRRESPSQEISGTTKPGAAQVA